MPDLITVPVATSFPSCIPYAFGMANIGINQAQVALKANVNDATTGSLNITDMVMPFDGSIVGITAILTNNKTAGVFGISPTIGGSEVGSTNPLYRVAIANSARVGRKTTDAQIVGLRFVAGNLIGAKVTTDGSFAAGSTPDLYVVVYVAFENVQL